MARSNAAHAALGRVISGSLALLLIACGGTEAPTGPDQNPVPSVTAVSPTDVTTDQGDFTLTVTGKNFVTSSVVRWNDADRPTTYVDAGTLRAEIPASDVGAAGTASITVFTAAPGGGVSSSLTFSILNRAPALVDLSMEGVMEGHEAFTLTVGGARFLESSVVQWNGSDRSTTYVRSDELRATIPASDVAAAGDASITVVTPPPGGGTSNSLTFSVLAPPTGQIAFVSDRDGNLEVYLMNADGTGQTNLTNNAASDWASAWSPDGSQIAFVSNRDGNGEIYVMNPDGTGVANLTNSSSGERGPVWSPDGSKILFVSNRDGNDEVYAMNADGSDQANLSNHAGDDWGPRWSPDGSQLAFVSDRDGNYEVYVMNADGTDQVNVTNNVALDGEPAWSPDGSQIVFDTNRNQSDGSRDDVYVMNADGTGAVSLTSGSADDINPSWSPDGSWIAFISADPGWVLKRVDVDGANEVVLGSAQPGRPGWSADGSWLVLESDADVYLTDPQGRVRLNLTNIAGEDYHPRWRPEP